MAGDNDSLIEYVKSVDSRNARIETKIDNWMDTHQKADDAAHADHNVRIISLENFRANVKSCVKYAAGAGFTGAATGGYKAGFFAKLLILLGMGS